MASYEIAIVMYFHTTMVNNKKQYFGWFLLVYFLFLNATHNPHIKNPTNTIPTTIMILN